MIDVYTANTPNGVKITVALEELGVADPRAATEGVECRKDKDVIDETPAACKDIDGVPMPWPPVQRVIESLVSTLAAAS